MLLNDSWFSLMVAHSFSRCCRVAVMYQPLFCVQQNEEDKHLELCVPLAYSSLLWAVTHYSFYKANINAASSMKPEVTHSLRINLPFYISITLLFLPVFGYFCIDGILCLLVYILVWAVNSFRRAAVSFRPSLALGCFFKQPCFYPHKLSWI